MIWKKVYSIYGIKWCVEFWILDHLMHRKEVVSIQTFLNQCHEPPKSSRLHRFRVAHSRNLSAHMFIILNNFAFAKNYLGIKIENKFYAIIKWLCPTFFLCVICCLMWVFGGAVVRVCVCAFFSFARCLFDCTERVKYSLRFFSKSNATYIEHVKHCLSMLFTDSQSI